MNIDIFGDSFSDTSRRNQDSDTWTDILEEKYDYTLRNFSKYGTGVQWNVEKFMQLEDYGDFLLFCLPDVNRISFDYLETNHDAAHALLIYNFMTANKDFEFPDTFTEKIIDQSEKIFKDFESFYTTGLHRILEVLFVTFILSKSIHYKKILIWPSSGVGFPFRFYSRKIEIPNNCYIVSKSMGLISQLELKTHGQEWGWSGWGGKGKPKKPEDFYDEKQGRAEQPVNPNTFTFGKDSRNSHLSYENHVIFAKQIFHFFANDINPKYEQFKTSFLEKY